MWTIRAPGAGKRHRSVVTDPARQPMKRMRSAASTMARVAGTPPFEPTTKGDLLIARGATDDKGQSFTHIKAVEAMLQEQYRGTYGFYQKLLPHIQEELLEEFRSGVPMAELREKIVDRYLQR